MRLWTFQADTSIEELKKDSLLTVKWSRYPSHGLWTKAYQWMALEMETKGIPCAGNAPIWAWHSCSVYGKSPTLDHAANLLSQLELQAGIQTIELECPDELALLTRYGAWNEVLYYFLDKKPISHITAAEIAAIYAIDPNRLEEHDAIQATLPYLKQEWVLDIRPLRLEAGNYEYDALELV